MALIEKPMQPGSLWLPPQQDELLSFVVENGENLPQGVNIEPELEAVMDGHGGTLQYWKPGEQVGTAKGFDRHYFQMKFDAACGILKSKGVEVDQADVDKTQEFIDEIFGVYSGERQPYRHGGSFAFVAASRTQRHSTAEDNFAALDYRRETVGCLPILKYVDEPTAQRMLVGMPPFVLDYYGEDSTGGGGIMIFAPLSLDMPNDLVEQHGVESALEMADNIAKETSWFARDRMGVKLMSLAALLPKVTNWGEMFKYPGIDTTTGHGGTTWLIGETVQKIINEGRIDPRLENRLGVIGVGGIGLAAADLMLGSNPDVQVAINDHIPTRLAEVAEFLQARYGENRVIVKEDKAELLKFGGVTVSAITKPIDLTRIGLKPGDLEGRAYADDSQPAQIASEQVIELGGQHFGVIAADGSSFGAVSPQRFNYGGMGPYFATGDAKKEPGNAYGCCVEGAALYYGGGMEHRLTAPVDGDTTRLIGEYCAKLGITAATLQTILHGKTQLV